MSRGFFLGLKPSRFAAYFRPRLTELAKAERIPL
jgi:hypothetical protein